MGRTYIRCLSDVAANGLVLQIDCGCGRTTWMGARDLIGRHVRGQRIFGWHGVTDLAPILRCRGCDRRGPTVRARYPREIGVPAGVPILPFLLADDRERKRMVRQARG